VHRGGRGWNDNLGDQLPPWPTVATRQFVNIPQQLSLVALRWAVKDLEVGMAGERLGVCPGDRFAEDTAGRVCVISHRGLVEPPGVRLSVDELLSVHGTPLKALAASSHQNARGSMRSELSFTCIRSDRQRQSASK
jgi:hypothetical protein